jgi:hypothetical protein
MYFLEDSHIVASAAVNEDEWVVVKMPVSLPYANEWEDTSGKEGLIKHGDQFYNIVEQRYQNDTLYTTLKTNISARERFFSIIEDINNLTGKAAEKSSKNPYSSLVKLLNQVSAVYISSYFTQNNLHLDAYLHKARATFQSVSFLSPAFPVTTPPPQIS